MDTIVKEYGGFLVALIAGIAGLSLFIMLIYAFRDNSKYIIANMTGVKVEDIQYITDVEE